MRRFGRVNAENDKNIQRDREREFLKKNRSLQFRNSGNSRSLPLSPEANLIRGGICGSYFSTLLGDGWPNYWIVGEFSTIWTGWGGSGAGVVSDDDDSSLVSFAGIAVGLTIAATDWRVKIDTHDFGEFLLGDWPSWCGCRSDFEGNFGDDLATRGSFGAIVKVGGGKKDDRAH